MKLILNNKEDNFNDLFKLLELYPVGLMRILPYVMNHGTVNIYLEVQALPGILLEIILILNGITVNYLKIRILPGIS